MGPLVTLLVLVFLGWAGVIFFQFRQTKTEALAVFEAEKSRGEIGADEDFAPYERAYLLTSPLRLAVYRWVSGIAAIIAFLVTIIIASYIWARLYYLNDRPDWMTEGELVHSFCLALCGMGALVFVAWVFVRRFHSHKPPLFDATWAAEKQKAQHNAQSGHTNPA